MPVRRARGDGDRGEGRGRRDLPGRRTRGRAAARGVGGRTPVGPHGHPAGRLRRPAHLVRRPAGPHARLHGRQRRHLRRQEPGLPGRHLPRRVRPAVGGTAVARHDPAGPQGTHRAAGGARRRGARRLHRLPEVRRQGDGRAALGRGPALGRDAVLDPGLSGRTGGAVPGRDGGGGPGTAAKVGPPQGPAPARGRPAPAGAAAPGRGEARGLPSSTLPWFAPDSDPGTAGRLSAPHDDSPTSPPTQTWKGST